MTIRVMAFGVLAIAAAIAGCSSGGSSYFAPGATGTLSTATPVTPTPSPTPSPSPSATPTPVVTPASGGLLISIPTFVGGGNGSCDTGQVIVFTGAGQSATANLSETGYSGSFTVFQNTNPNAATVSISSSNVLTVTADNAGQTIFTIQDTNGNRQSCGVSVTLSSGTVSSIRRKRVGP